ncbi:uncharacterized protein LOC111269349 [Varroa jacobsoni]|uniref:uncharacterized protein LOC111269349 n=1 Tax=Varroa jacobsoni TaxID=62625 RepID=UPI000BF7CDE8|nr:uncharacterized protein LOC111269349 [Varroa jacobsoni]
MQSSASKPPTDGNSNEEWYVTSESRYHNVLEIAALGFESASAGRTSIQLVNHFIGGRLLKNKFSEAECILVTYWEIRQLGNYGGSRKGGPRRVQKPKSSPRQ